MQDNEITAEINRFREKLLDLTNRNPLLNYRKSTRRTLQIVDELPDQIYQRLVGDGKKFRFAPLVKEDVVKPSARETSESESNGDSAPNRLFREPTRQFALPLADSDTPPMQLAESPSALSQLGIRVDAGR